MLKLEAAEPPTLSGEPAGGERDLGLTARQIEVACLLVDGLTYTQIAARLALSPHTVHEHIRHIYVRLGCRRGSLIAALVRAGRCDPPQK